MAHTKYGYVWRFAHIGSMFFEYYFYVENMCGVSVHLVRLYVCVCVCGRGRGGYFVAFVDVLLKLLFDGGFVVPKTMYLCVCLCTNGRYVYASICVQADVLSEVSIHLFTMIIISLPNFQNWLLIQCLCLVYRCANRIMHAP